MRRSASSFALEGASRWRGALSREFCSARMGVARRPRAATAAFCETPAVDCLTQSSDGRQTFTGSRASCSWAGGMPSSRRAMYRANLTHTGRTLAAFRLPEDPAKSDRAPPPRPRVPVPPSTRPRVPVPPPPTDLVDELNQVREAFNGILSPESADEAFSAVLSSDRFGGEWQQVLTELQTTGGLRGAALAKLISNNPEVLALSADAVLRPMLLFLTEEIGLYGYDLRRTLLKMPRLLQTPLGGEQITPETQDRPVVRGRNPEPRQVVSILMDMGLDAVDVRIMVAKYPGFLLLPPARINGVLDFLSREMIGFSRDSAAPMIKRAPWVLAYQATADLEPVGRFLASIGLIPSEPLIRCHPDVLGADVEYQLRPVYRFLIGLGIRFDVIPKMLRSYPRILTTSVPDRIQPVIYCLKDIGLTDEEISSAVRSFPSILLLDVVDDIRPKEEYFASRGISNMRRIVSRVPAILSYDLAKVIVPKYNYLERHLNLTNYELLTFPAYFQYDLESRIWPRTTFVLSLGLRIEDVGLNNTLAPTDEDFCNWTVKLGREQYDNFVQRLPPVKSSKALAKGARRSKRRRPRPQAQIPIVDGRLLD